MTSRASFSYRDASNEISNAAITLEEVTAINYATVMGYIDVLSSDIDDLTLCENAGVTFSELAVAGSADLPASPYAQRELGLRVFFHDDTTGKKYHLTIPGPNLAALTIVAGTDNVVLADASVMADFVGHFESYAVSEVGNAVVVDRAVIVGRRN